MNIKACFNTDKERIHNKEYNILVPICLGNKFFSRDGVITDNVKKFVTWALENTKEKVLILVVDKIQDTNYFVRHGHKSEVACRRKVLKDGKKIYDALYQIIDQFFNDKKSQIILIRYEDYESDDLNSKDISNTVHNEFESDKAFNQAVLASVKSSVIDRKFSEQEYYRLCNYVLDEFALVYAGAEYGSNFYGLYIYPEADSVSDLIFRIQTGVSFKKLQEKLPPRKVGLAILNEG
jgi:tRNA-dependent cyclodipeptide synthase